jgi:pheromone shutdown protein TraB
VYGDRDVQHTLRRLAETVDLQQLLRMASGSGMPEPPAVRVLF